MDKSIEDVRPELNSLWGEKDNFKPFVPTNEDRMRLWNRVCKTNPKHTKKVTYGRKFTAIDAMYQIQMATEQFGMAGEGWGWNFSEPLFPVGGTVVIKCILWHKKKENTVEHFGQCALADSNGKFDRDALKKAATDGLTKCLSYLGFNADVFLGRFDDNKYVEELEVEFGNKPENNIAPIKGGVNDSDGRNDAKEAWLKQIYTKMDKVGSLQELQECFTEKEKDYVNKTLVKLDPVACAQVKNRKKELESRFKEAESSGGEAWDNA